MEDCDNSDNEVKEVQLNAAALKDPDAMHTPISFPDHSSLDSSGLVDSGSSHCFADPLFISSNNLPSYDIPPVTLRLLDGLVGEVITKATDIRIRFSTKDVLLLKFYITKLDSHSAFVFRHNWLHCYNPSIDWYAGQILDFRQLLPSVLSSSHIKATGSPVPPMSRPSSASDLLPSVTSTFASASVPLGNVSLPSVSFINTATYSRLAHVKGNTIFSVTISNSDIVSGCSASAEQVDLSGIPEDYHEYTDVFSKSQASNLLPHRPYDLQIDLKEGAEPPVGRMYSLSNRDDCPLRIFG
jgi:hypothetical protein